jgi:hypothetical protein
MDIDDLFHSPSDCIARFAEIQVHLYRHDVTLQDYFLALDNEMFGGPRKAARSLSQSRLAWPRKIVDRAAQLRGKRKFKADILFCPTPYFGRETELRLLSRTLLGLAETGAEILCLLSPPNRKELDAELEAAGYSKQVTFLDITIPFNRLEDRLRVAAAMARGHAAFRTTVDILAPYGLSPTTTALPDFERAARFTEAWERVAPLIEFDAVVARCHWFDLCSPVCRTGLQRGKPVITFQQGVVDHTLDVPITASKFVTFGESSASVLAEANRRFFAAVEMPEPPVEFCSAGSLFDVVVRHPNQFALQSVLFIDFHSSPGDPWGTAQEVQGLSELAEKLLTARLPLRRLLIRPHPHWSNLDLGSCLKVIRARPEVCELSHPVLSLEHDMSRCSIVVGIGSGVLTVASAAGLPTIFLRTERGFKDRDLECFSPAQTLLPDAAFREVSRLLTDSESYAEARQVAMRNASHYYANGANAALDGAFFTRLLDNQPLKKA